ncbi:uncharacterized protein LOC135463878 [Liolophura sinensis]|uniref:uncharacterized protein LOC135463878 n=1 Tax=Liolophura sinensis TaxID=3198878 RepID=UPI00315932EB
MGVTLERVQNKFACIIGELCSEPDILSQFAVWVDLRIAEYKAKGAISLDCSGTTPDPTWLKGLKQPKPVQSDPVLEGNDLLLASRNARHKHHGISNSARRVQPEPRDVQTNRDMASRARVIDGEYEISVKDEPSDCDRVFPVSLHSNNGSGHMGISHNNSSEQRLATGESSEALTGYLGSDVNRLSPTMLHSRKRSFSNAEERSISLAHSDAKTRRLSLASKNNFSAGHDSTQSLLSVIGVNNASVEPSSKEEGQLRGHNSGRMSDSTDPNQTVARGSDWRNGPETDTQWTKGPNVDVDVEGRHAPDVEVVEIMDHELDVVESVVAHREMMLRYAAEGRVPAMWAQGVDSSLGQQRVRWSSRMSLIKPRSTHKNTKCAVRTLRTWLTRYNDYREIETIPPPELDSYLVDFFSTIKRKNGSDYHPSSLNSLRKFLDFHLKENGYPHSITTSASFNKCQVAFRMKFIELSNLLSGKETRHIRDSSFSFENQTDISQAEDASSQGQALVDHQELDSGQDVHTTAGQQGLWPSDHNSEGDDTTLL